MSKAIKFAEQWSEYINGCCEMIDQMNPHAANANENVGHGEIGKVKIHSNAESSLYGDGNNHSQVAK